ncbi:P35 lipoprotein homolog [Malacoplasma penetrans HF-2]|uniref:P35 lipoprotein homolog n=1 Tax=Malacoplasma penetrans (strain HF-2) TaxID=272633 RepID=Q8EV91_MALP2|nr:P35 family lipoprotein [Malacoplasma penetrans]BAC44467.1 P35 lipoprotein homolog [Malacoplasma penetrans HF-2]
MKIKKIKLLKALAMTGAFGIVATVPVIVSSCSSTSDNNGNNNGGNGNQQTQTITPELNETVNLSGSLSDIYDSTGTLNANQKIAADIKDNHLSDVFANGQALSEVSDLSVTVSGEFSRALWTGLTFNGETGNWEDSEDNSNNITIADANKLVYTSESDQINIESLDDLHNKLSVRETLKTALENAGVASIPETTTLAVSNNLGFTNGDLLHVNVTATPTGASATATNYDLQIPVSNLNLVVPNLTITVAGTNVGEANRTTTNFNFNVGIDPTLNFSQTGNAPSATTDEVTGDDAASTILQKLGYTTATGSTDLSNDKISAALGIYNCKFTPTNATENTSATATNNGNKVYTVTVTAEPYDTSYVWDDGSSGSKEFTFDVSLTVN